MDRTTMIAHLEHIAGFLTKPARLIIAGSAVGIFCGQENRRTKDIDVIREASKFDSADLFIACSRANLDFNLQEYDVPSCEYLQIVSEKLVPFGQYSTFYRMAQFGKLQVGHLPPENLIASKLVRASEQDIQDILFLKSHFHVANLAIDRVIDSFHEVEREAAMENLVLASTNIARQREARLCV